MNVTRTIRLSDKERLAVQDCLKLTEEISDIVGCTMDDVFDYFSEISTRNIESGKYHIGDSHQIANIQ